MRHLQTNVISRRISKGIARRRQLGKKLISVRKFCEINEGRVFMRVFGEQVLCKFFSDKHQKYAHAWSSRPSKAYRNMLRNFHEKYAS
jgi:hypothetical protein